MSLARNDGQYRPGSIPCAYDSAFIEKTYSKNLIFKVDLNKIAWGDTNGVNEVLNLLEDNIIKRLRENKYTGIYDFRTLPFLWKPPAHHATCHDDKNPCRFFGVYKTPINLAEVDGENFGFVGRELFSPQLNLNMTLSTLSYLDSPKSRRFHKHGS